MCGVCLVKYREIHFQKSALAKLWHLLYCVKIMNCEALMLNHYIQDCWFIYLFLSLKLNSKRSSVQSENNCQPVYRSLHFSVCESCEAMPEPSARSVLTQLIFPARMPSHGCPQTVLCHCFDDPALGGNYLSLWVSLFATGSANPQQRFGRAKHRGSIGPCSERYQHFAHD